MKILFLEQFSELGGGQRNLLDLLPAVIAEGHQAVVAAPGSGLLFERAQAMGAAAIHLPLPDYSNGRKSAMDAARFPLDTIRLSLSIARQNCDLISVGGARLLPAVALAARGRRVIFQAQHFYEEARALKLARWAIRKSGAQVIANSKYVASQFDNARVVYNGVEEIPFVERDFNTPLKFGIIGRIAPMKGQTDFLRSAAILAPLLPNSSFHIYGEPMFTAPEYVEEVHRLAASLPVHFEGWRDDLGAVFRELSLLIVPSTAAEATTRVILEAFSAGVPVVAYSVGGIPEIVRDGENAFLVPKRTPEALAGKILEVLQRDLRGIAAEARGTWQDRYTIQRYRDQMMELISPIPASHRRKT